MSFDDFLDSTPSVSGFGMTSAAAVIMEGFVPMAVLLAAMQGTAISDPAQMSHAASRHDDVAAQAKKLQGQLNAAVAAHIPLDKFSSDDKNAFTTEQLQPYLDNLGKTADTHTAIATALRGQASAQQTIGLVSMAMGGFMLASATCLIAGLATLFGIPAAIAAANAGTSAGSSVFRQALVILQALAGGTAKVLMMGKVVLALAAFEAANDIILQPMHVKAATTGAVTTPPPKVNYVPPATATTLPA
jgi:hypothetical protein